MKIVKADFVISAVKTEQFPEDDRPEIVFCGKSNVGKSSLINYLLGRKKLAKTSSTPGKTQTINFFNINDKFRFVDLPGYGYAKVSKKKKSQWPKFIEHYFSSRKNIISAFVLVDIRRNISDDDRNMIKYIEYFGHVPQIILTKGDKLNQSDKVKARRKLSRELGVDEKNIFITSTLKKQGKYKIWDNLNFLFKENEFDIFVERVDG
ncbi:MAG: YihA family ribosome biogenesis GTP-binding protein [Clostridiales bacterium]|nr:MAG: YihA family ribosome biogenesis GTP-binding protein [Clostridiales bacterium]